MKKEFNTVEKLRWVLDYKRSKLSLVKYLKQSDFGKTCCPYIYNEESYLGYQTFYKWVKLYDFFGVAGFGKGAAKIMSKAKQENRSVTEQEREQLFKKLIEQSSVEELKQLITILFSNLSELNDYDRINRMKLIRDTYSMYKKSVTLKALLIIAKVKESTYHNYFRRHKEIDGRKRNDKQEIIKKIWEIYLSSKGIYGYRKVAAILRLNGYVISDNTVWSYCKEINAQSKIRRHAKKPPEPKDTKFKCENVLDRKFKNNSIKVFCSDITYIPFNKYWLFLCATIDLDTNSIVAFTISDTQDSSIVEKTINQIKYSDKAIFHSDHGSQYSSSKIVNQIKSRGWIQSMSRVGNALDNRPIEYWFSILKSELINDIDTSKLTQEEFTLIIKEYIRWYNEDRIQTTLKNYSPAEYKRIGH